MVGFTHKEFFEYLNHLPPELRTAGVIFVAIYGLVALAMKVLGNERLVRTRHDRLKSLDGYLKEAGLNEDLALTQALREQRQTWIFLDVFGINAGKEMRAALLALKATAGHRLGWYTLKRAAAHLQLTDEGHLHVHLNLADRLVYVAHGLMALLAGGVAFFGGAATLWFVFRPGMKLEEALRLTTLILTSAGFFLYAVFSLEPGLRALSVRRVLQSLPADRHVLPATPLGLITSPGAALNADVVEQLSPENALTSPNGADQGSIPPTIRSLP